MVYQDHLIDERYTERVTAQLKPSQMQELDAWRNERGLASEAAAVRFIILERLKTDREKGD